MTDSQWPGLRGDHHVHSTYSDDAESTMEENIAAARAIGLTQLRLVDHVRASSQWVPEFCKHSSALAKAATELTIRTGVEAKILDAAGRLDLPSDLRTGPDRADLVDRVLIADHQYPGRDGPLTPSMVMAERAAGLTAAAIVDTLVTATIAALSKVEHAQLAHPFSLLPKVGLSEADLLDDHLLALSSAALACGAWVEINEKWGCPGPRVIAAFATAGVTLVASTDSHHCRDVGRYQRVVELSHGLFDADSVHAPAGPRQ
jgi:putative hydrolase